MTLRKLASEIARRESLKKQVSIGNVREILGVLSDVAYEEYNDFFTLLYKNGERRAKRRKRKAGAR